MKRALLGLLAALLLPALACAQTLIPGSLTGGGTITGPLTVTGTLNAQSNLDMTNTTITRIGSARWGVNSDTMLFADAANTLALRNSTSAQTFNVYNTYTDASNYERLGVFYTSNIAVIRTQQAGTGAARDLYLGTEGAANVSLLTNNTKRWDINSSGHLIAETDNSYDIGASGANRPRDIYLARYVQVGSTTVGALKTCNAAAEGSEISVTDANATTFHSTVAAGGANHVKVVCLNSTWVIGG
jgi:hypothetical protein